MTIKRQCAVMDAHIDAVQTERGYAESRRHCELLRATARRAPLRSISRIPVVVHVVYNSSAENIPDANIHEQIRILNEDFRAKNTDIDQVPKEFKHLIADPKIEFELATQDPYGFATDGIVRHKTNIARFPGSLNSGESTTAAIDRELKASGTGSAAWPRDAYLNIWVCNMDRNPLGYAAFPGAAAWRDGIVVDYRCFGASAPAEPPFNLGRTTTHEVGHFLDLLHIWGDDRGGCHGSDNIADTPNQAGPNYDEPTFPSRSCGNGPDGDLFMNFMDYVNDNAMFMFTKDQVTRMHATLQGQRVALLSSTGLDTPRFDRRRDEDDAQLIAKSIHDERHTALSSVFDGVGWVTLSDSSKV